MPQYFFDTRDDDMLKVDNDGVDYPNLEVVKVEAARSLTDLARDVIPGSVRRLLVVEVRDAGGPVLKAMMQFEAIILRPV